MRPADLPLDIYRGDALRLRVKLWDQNNQPIDLTSVIVKSEIRNRPGGDFIMPFVCTITLPNIIDLFLPSASSQQLPLSAVWDLQLNFGLGEVQTPLGGQITVTPDVTESTPTLQQSFV